MIREKEDDIQEIQSWVEKQKFLPSDLPRNYIRTFLLGCKWDKVKTKKVIENYFYARQSVPEIFTKRDPLLKENLAAWKSSCFVPLNGKLDGCRVFLGASLETDNYDYVNFVKQVFMCYDLMIRNDEWDNGDRILIFSYDKVKYQNLSTFNLYITRKTAECGSDNYLPGKIKALHNIHLPPFMNKIHNRFKPFLSAEDEKVVQFHTNLKSLHKYVDQQILPQEFGGNAGPLKSISGMFCPEGNRVSVSNNTEKPPKEHILHCYSFINSPIVLNFFIQQACAT